jgi:hypothetical protein
MILDTPRSTAAKAAVAAPRPLRSIQQLLLQVSRGTLDHLADQRQTSKLVYRDTLED